MLPSCCRSVVGSGCGCGPWTVGVNLALSVGRSAIDLANLIRKLPPASRGLAVAPSLQKGALQSADQDQQLILDAWRPPPWHFPSSKCCSPQADEAVVVSGALALATSPLNPSTPPRTGLEDFSGGVVDQV